MGPIVGEWNHKNNACSVAMWLQKSSSVKAGKGARNPHGKADPGNGRKVAVDDAHKVVSS